MVRSFRGRWLLAFGFLALSLTLLWRSETLAEATGLEIVSDYGPELLAYVTVHRSDGTYRRMLISPEALEDLARGDPLPEGTRILMETYYQPGRVGTVFHKRKADGHWLYGSFSASRPDLSVRAQASCLSCHAQAADTDFTFTAPSVWAAAAGHGPSEFACDRGGRSPCASQTYLEGAAK